MLVHGIQNDDDTIETVISFSEIRAFRYTAPEQGSDTNLTASIHGSLFFLDSMVFTDT